MTDLHFQEQGSWLVQPITPKGEAWKVAGIDAATNRWVFFRSPLGESYINPETPQSAVRLRLRARGFQFCPQALEPHASIVAELPKRGEPYGPNLSRRAMTSCQDTLTPADRAVQWRGHRVSSLLSVAPKGILNVGSSNIGGVIHFARERTPMVSSSL